MAKRKQDTTRTSTSESKEERKERKRLRKEAKKQQKQQRQALTGKSKSNDNDNNEKLLPDNIFFRKKLELTISLFPGALGHVQKSIEDAIRLLLLKYSDGLQGILLAFENVHIVSDISSSNNNNNINNVGLILNDLPHIHYRVITDALVFCPAVGCELTGVVTEACFPSHLSLVVLHYFNASIPAEQMHAAGFEFEDDQWYYYDNDEVNAPDTSNKRIVLEKGASSVTFTCQKIYESAGIISLTGIQPVLLRVLEEAS